MTLSFRQSTGAAGGIVLCMAAAAVINIIAHSLLAFHFGAGRVTDAFFMAKDISEVLTKFFLGGQIALVFLPILVRYREQYGEDVGWAVCATLFTVAISVLGIFTLMLFPLAPAIVAILAPGFAGLTRLLTIKFLKVLLPTGALDVLSGMAAAILQSRNRFLLPAVIELVGPLIFLASLMFAASTAGPWALVIGVVGGSLGRTALLFFALHRAGMRFRWSFRLDAPIRETARGGLPLLLPQLAREGSSAVYKIVVSGFPAGTLTAIAYADRILKGIFGLIMVPVTTVLFPRLALAHARGRAEEVGRMLRRAIFAIGFFLLPITAAILIASRPMVTVLFRRGAFDATATDFTVLAMSLGVLWFFWNGCYGLLSRACFVIQKAGVVAVFTTGGEVIQALFYFILARLLSFAGLVLAPVCYTVLLTLAFYRFLVSQLPGLRGLFVNSAMIKIALASVFAGLGSWGVMQAIAGAMEGGVIGALWQLIGGVVAMAGLLLLQARLFGREEIEEILGSLRVKGGVRAEVR